MWHYFGTDSNKDFTPQDLADLQMSYKNRNEVGRIEMSEERTPS